MPGRTSARALRDEGLERTDNEMEFTSWPQVSMINQKNYYTEFMKRDDQILALRLQQEDSRNRMTKAARDKDRAMANGEVDGDGDETMMGGDDANAEEQAQEAAGSRIVVIHAGSQNLRIGFSTDVIPKTVPMVIARRAADNEPEKLENDEEPIPKRRKVDSDNPSSDELFGSDFAASMSSMGQDIKNRMRRKGRRIVPNSREQAISFNKKNPPTVITEHNDSFRVDWTEITPPGASSPPDYFTGNAALRVPDDSNPRYKLYWPLRYGFFNEEDYDSKDQILRDFMFILEDAMSQQLSLQKKDWPQYSCVFVIPDLYERYYITTALDLLVREMGFSSVCFIQESLAGSFGAGYPTCVIVDVGASKTSICCVDEGMCLENSRINLRYGGDDVTELFSRMMLFDRFPYQELDLRKRHDFLVAEELKQKFCSLDVENISLQQGEFHVRVFNQNTRHYLFKAYDEVIMAPMGYFMPELFDNSNKLKNRRHLIERSYDIYDSSPSDPVSTAQNQVLAENQPDGLQPAAGNDAADTPMRNGTPAMKVSFKPAPSEEPGTSTPKPGQGSPAPGGDDNTPQPRAGSPSAGGADGGPLNITSNPLDGSKTSALPEQVRAAEARDASVPLMSLARAIILSIETGAKGDDRKMRDFFGGIIPVGGGAQVANFNQFLEEELKESTLLGGGVVGGVAGVGVGGRFGKDIMVAPPPREIDPTVLVWKGASVFGKLKSNDSWIGQLEYDRLGNRILAYKTLWNF